MSNYLFVYRAPQDYLAGAEGIAEAWQSWFEELGSSLVDTGNPVFDRRRGSLGSTPPRPALGPASCSAGSQPSPGSSTTSTKGVISRRRVRLLLDRGPGVEASRPDEELQSASSRT